jgi:hypothetical protein
MLPGVRRVSTLVLCFVLACGASSQAVRRIPSDIAGVAVSLRVQAPNGDYLAQTYSGVPLDSTYARERCADRGLVTLHCAAHGGESAARECPAGVLADDDAQADAQTVRAFRVPRDEIDVIATARYEMDVLDRTDVVFARTRTVVVHTTSANAGIFVVSDVWELPRVRSEREYLQEIASRHDPCAPEEGISWLVREAVRAVASGAVAE